MIELFLFLSVVTICLTVVFIKKTNKDPQLEQMKAELKEIRDELKETKKRITDLKIKALYGE